MPPWPSFSLLTWWESYISTVYNPCVCSFRIHLLSSYYSLNAVRDQEIQGVHLVEGSKCHSSGSEGRACYCCQQHGKASQFRSYGGGHWPHASSFLTSHWTVFSSPNNLWCFYINNHIFLPRQIKRWSPLWKASHGFFYLPSEETAGWQQLACFYSSNLITPSSCPWQYTHPFCKYPDSYYDGPALLGIAAFSEILSSKSHWGAGALSMWADPLP